MEYVVFYYKVHAPPFILPKTMCLRIPFLLPSCPLFGQSQVTSSWFQKQQEFKIQISNIP